MNFVIVVLCNANLPLNYQAHLIFIKIFTMTNSVQTQKRLKSHKGDIKLA